jgi:hypothetical protein
MCPTRFIFNFSCKRKQGQKLDNCCVWTHVRDAFVQCLTLELTKSSTRHHSNDSGICIHVRDAFFRRPSMESTVAVDRYMIWLIIAFFRLAMSTHSFCACRWDRPKIILNQCRRFNRSEFIFARIDLCCGSMVDIDSSFPPHKKSKN